MLIMQLIAQSNGLNLYWQGDMILAGTFNDAPMTEEQEVEADKLFELFLMDFEGRA